MSWLIRLKNWPYMFAVLISLGVAGIAVGASAALHIPLHDPEGFIGPAYIRLPVLALIFFGVGIVLTALDRHNLRNPRTLPRSVLREVRTTWNLRRVFFIVTGLFCFYACYTGYRNLKSVLPVVRDSVAFDSQLTAVDRFLLGDAGPAAILHTVLGTDLAAQFLSFVYLAYIPLVPISLGAFLVLVRNLRIGAWYTSALCLNWVLGTASYYLLPALGPVYYRPSQFQDLAQTNVGALQEAMYHTRLSFLSDPALSGQMHGIAAFASLHVSVTFTAALLMSRSGRPRLLTRLAWIYFGLVLIATLYFGWHYIADDVAGLVIGWASVTLGGRVTRSSRPRPLKPTPVLAPQPTSPSTVSA